MVWTFFEAYHITPDQITGISKKGIAHAGCRFGNTVDHQDIPAHKRIRYLEIVFVFEPVNKEQP